MFGDYWRALVNGSLSRKTTFLGGVEAGHRHAMIGEVCGAPVQKRIVFFGWPSIPVFNFDVQCVTRVSALAVLPRARQGPE